MVPRAAPAAGAAAAAPPAEAQGDHQGGPERILHLHDRRHGDDPQRLVEADAELRGPDGALQDPVPLPACRSTAINSSACIS